MALCRDVSRILFLAWSRPSAFKYLFLVHSLRSSRYSGGSCKRTIPFHHFLCKSCVALWLSSTRIPPSFLSLGFFSCKSLSFTFFLSCCELLLYDKLSLGKTTFFFLLSLLLLIIKTLLEYSCDFLLVSVVDNLGDVPLSVHFFIFFLERLLHEIMIVVLDTPFIVDILDCDMQQKLLKIKQFLKGDTYSVP